MTFNSVYEITNPLTKVAEQRIIEDFSSNMTGNEPPNGWNLSNINGGTTGGTIYDSDADEGYKVNFSTQQYAWGGLTFNGKRTFDLNAVSFIVTVKRTFGSSSGGYWAGLSNVTSTNQNDTVAFSSNTGSRSNFHLFLKGGTTSATDSDITVDDNWHTGKVESRASSVSLSIDGVFKATVGTGMGSVKAQPSITAIDNSTDSGNSFSVRYFEAWNY